MRFSFFTFPVVLNLLVLWGCPGTNPGDAPPPDKPKEETPAPQDAGSVVSNPQVDAGNAVPNPGVDAGSEVTNPAVDAGNEVTNPSVDAGTTVADPVVDAGSDVTNSGVDAGSEVTNPGVDAGTTVTNPVVDAGSETPPPAVDAGNETPAPEVDAGNTVVADTTAPETTLDAHPDALTNDSQASFAFTANEAPVTFLCSLNSETPTACTSPYTVSLTTDGEHTFTVAAVDAAGNADATPATYTWELDTTPPATTINDGPDALTNVAQATFNFSSDDASATFECRLDSEAFAACTSPHTLTLTADGSHTFEAKAADSLGNTESAPASFTWELDTAPPSTTIDSGPNALTNVAQATFNFSSDDASATFECRLDNEVFAACTSPHTLTLTADGLHTFEVKATDSLGNTHATPASFNWELDTETPVASLSETPEILSNETTATFVFGSDDTDCIFECRMNTDLFAPCSSPYIESNLAEGTHSFDVRCTDAAGNEQNPSSGHMWGIDITAPETTIDSGAADALTNVTTATFTFTSNEEPSAFQCSFNSAPFEACDSPHPVTVSSDGEQAFAVTATDAFGNEDPTPATHTWDVDTTAPDTTITQGPDPLTTDTSATFIFSSDDDAAIFGCRIDNETFVFCTSPYERNSLSEGSHTVEIQAVDALGNVEQEVATQTWEIDNTPPITTIYSNPNALSNDSTPDFVFFSNEDNTTFECRIDEASFSACASPFESDLIADGTHVFEVRGTDVLGNAATTPTTFTWVQDTVPPEFTAFTPPAALLQDATATFTFEADDDDITFYCRFNNEVYQACTSPYQIQGFPSGNHVVYVYVVDAAGNESIETKSWSFEAALCGNTAIDNGEVCDEPLDCLTLDATRYEGGFATCSNDCTAYSVSTCGLRLFTDDSTHSLEIPYNAINFPYEIRSADLNSDGQMDILWADHYTGELLWFENEANTFTKKSIATDTNLPTDLTPADVDGDGDMDVVSAYADQAIAWHENDGAGNFTKHVITTSLEGPIKIAAADMDLDGDMDIVSVSAGDCNTLWFENDSSQNFTEHLVHNQYGSKIPTRLVVTDLDGDGNRDIVTNQVQNSSGYNPHLYWHKNDGSQNFTKNEIGSGGTEFTVGDIDSDGDLDLLAFKMQGNSGRVVWLESLGNATFASQVLIEDLEEAFDLESADMDGDGDLDIILSDHYDYKVAWLDNDGQMGFSKRYVYDLSQSYDDTVIHISDMDGDGDLDVMSGNGKFNQWSGRLKWHENLLYDCDTWGATGAQCDQCTSPHASGQDCNICADDYSGPGCFIAPETPSTYWISTPDDIHFDLPVTFDFMSPDSEATFECRLDDGDFTACTPPLLLTELSFGPHQMAVRAVNTAGLADPTPMEAAFFQNAHLTLEQVPSTGDDTNATFIFSFQHTGFTFECDLDGVVTDCASPVSYSDLSYAPHLFRITPISPEGIAGFPTEHAWVVSTFEDFLLGNVVSDNRHHIDTGIDYAINIVAIDVNQDGYNDLASINDPPWVTAPAIVWYENGGHGDFTAHQKSVYTWGGVQEARYLDVADLDSDGDLDFIAALDYGMLQWNKGPSLNSQKVVATHNDDGHNYATAADINGDGFMDVIAVITDEGANNSIVNELAWYEHGGDFNTIAYTKKTILEGIPEIDSLEVVDLNNDGVLDLLWGTASSEPAKWYQNDGNGSFTPNVFSANGAAELLTADINSDGHLDIVAARNSLTEQIMWYENDGVGNFTEHALVTDNQYEGFAYSLHDADFDNDGHIDLLFEMGEFLLFYHNDGSVNFTSHLVDDTCCGNNIQTADLDHDGDLDVIRQNHVTETMTWYENRLFDCETPGFTGAQCGQCTSPHGSGENCENCDNGYENPSCLLPPTAPFTFLTSGPGLFNHELPLAFEFSSHDASATFECQLDDADYAPCTSPTVISELDFGFHRMNIRAISSTGLKDETPVAVHFVQDFLLTLEEAPQEGPETSATFVFSYSAANFTFECVIDDIMSTCTSPFEVNNLTVATHTFSVTPISADGIRGETIEHQWNTISFAEHALANTGTDIRHIVTDQIVSAKSVFAADMNNDGHMDLLSAAYGTYPEYNGQIAWHKNDGIGNFTTHVISTALNCARSVFAVDIDGDGDLDALSGYSCNIGKGLVWHENNGNEIFTSHTVDATVNSNNIFAGDLDGDDDIDFLSSGPSVVTKWYKNDGNQNFSAHPIGTETEGSFVAVMADMNGDGHMDVLWGSDSGYMVAWYENNGYEVFSKHIIFHNPVYPRMEPIKVVAADLDGDSDMDAITVSNSGKIKWHENDGNENFTTHLIAETPVAPSFAALDVADMDMDGDLDLVSGSQWNDSVTLHANDGDENFISHTIELDDDAGSYSVITSDMDSDGDLDVVASWSYGSSRITIYENRIYGCDSGFTGTDCDQCTYPTASGENCDTCTENWGGAHCNVCLVAGGCGE